MITTPNRCAKVNLDSKAGAKVSSAPCLHLGLSTNAAQKAWRNMPNTAAEQTLLKAYRDQINWLIQKAGEYTDEGKLSGRPRAQSSDREL